MAIDGANATPDEMKKLHAVCRKIKNKRDTDWHCLLVETVGLDVTAGHWEGNLRRGDANQGKVLTLYRWIIANELEFAAEADSELFNLSLKTGWEGFLDRHGQYGNLHVRPYDDGDDLGLHDISASVPLSETRIRLGQEFFFELDSPIAGSAIGLVSFKNQWYPFPLTNKASQFDPIKLIVTTHALPLDPETQEIAPLRQRGATGEYGHVILIGPDGLLKYYSYRFQAGTAILQGTLDDMARRLDQVEAGRLAVCRENVLFE